jgi:hypothetical protein
MDLLVFVMLLSLVVYASVEQGLLAMAAGGAIAPGV